VYRAKQKKDVADTFVTRNPREELYLQGRTIVLLMEIEILYWRKSTIAGIVLAELFLYSQNKEDGKV